MAQIPDESIAIISLQPQDENAHDTQTVLATKEAAQAIEVAAVVGEALDCRHFSGHGSIPDTIVIDKSSPVSQEEAAMLESLTATLSGGQVPKGSIAARAQWAAVRGESDLEIPLNEEIARKIHDLTGIASKGGFASEVMSVAHRLEQASINQAPGEGTARLTLESPDLRAVPAKSIVTSKEDPEAIKDAAAINEARFPQHMSGHRVVPDTIFMEKSTPVIRTEVSITAGATGGEIHKGSLPTHFQAVAAKGGIRCGYSSE